MGYKFLCCGRSGDDEETPTPNRPAEESKSERKKNPSAQDQKESNSEPRAHWQKGKPDLPASTPTEPGASGPSSSFPKMSYAGGNKPGTHQDKPYSELNSAPPMTGKSEKFAGDQGPSGSAMEHSIDGKHGNFDGPMPSENPPPYHDWQETVPDTSSFPPPPVHAYLYSHTGNASKEDAELAHDFCDNTPLWSPVTPSDVVYDCVQRADLRPVIPREYSGDLGVKSNGKWKGTTREDCRDCLLLTGLPLYFAAQDSPFVTEKTKTIYFEVKLIRTYGGPNTQTAGFSIGYAAQPYPTWRSPGWERGSVGVFSDDGCRFVNDSWGGREFTTEFLDGETVGLGMTFSLGDQQHNLIGQSNPRPIVDIFFTRNGTISGGWDLHEPVDADSGTLEGLEGDFDLYGALGLFGGVEFEVCFDPYECLWDGTR